MFQTAEVARNPTPEIRVRCTQCKKEYSISSSLQEILVEAERIVVEGVLVCPHCQHKKHVYYMTENLRYRQRILQQRALEWQQSQTADNYRKLIQAKSSYQNSYDKMQKKYEKEFGDGSDKK